jgi:histidine triad (HIT) family protein
MDNCLFCKIIKGEIPCYKIYEDEYTLAFLDIAKDVDGHTLVIPKKHCSSILDCDEETLNHVMRTVKLISNHYVNKCGFSGINVLNNNGSSAEQAIHHLHIHIIPRIENDNIYVFPKFQGAKYSLEENLEKLKIK